MDHSAVLQACDKYCSRTHLNLVWQRRVEKNNLIYYVYSSIL